MSTWYEDWQHPEHSERFDARSQLGLRSLIRNYEAFNDVQLLQATGHRLLAFPYAPLP